MHRRYDRKLGAIGPSFLVAAGFLLWAAPARAGCSPDGATQACTVSGCVGTRTCNYPAWSACVCDGLTFSGSLTNNAGTGFTSPGATVSVIDSSGAGFAGPSTLGSSTYSFSGVSGGSGNYTVQADVVAGYSVRTQTGTGAFMIGNTSSGLTASKAVNFKYDPVATLSLTAVPAVVTAGNTITVTVQAKDAFGNIAWGYRGSVHFTSSATSATLPGAYTFSASDQGQRTFSLQLNTLGNDSITVADASLSATTSVTVVAAPQASITSPSYATVSTSFTASVPAQANSTYAWTIVAGDGGPPSPTNTNTVTVPVGASTGSLTVRCTVTNQAGTVATGSGTVTVVAAPTTPAITAATYVTVGFTGLTASIAAQGSDTYVWTVSGGSGAVVSSGGTTTSATYTAGSATGTLTLSCTVYNLAGTGVTGTRVVTVVAAPVVPLVTAPGYATQGATGLSATSTSQANTTYSWALSGGSGAAIAGGTTGTAITFGVGTVTGNLTVSCSASNLAGTVATGSTTVHVVAPPNATITLALASGSSTSTPAESVNNASVPAQGGTFTWQLIPVNTLAGYPAVITSGGSTNSIQFNPGGLAPVAANLYVQATVTNQAGTTATSTSAGIFVTPDGSTVTPVVSGVPASPINPYSVQSFNLGLQDAYGNAVTNLTSALTIQYSTLNPSDQVPAPIIVPAGAFSPLSDTGVAFHAWGSGQQLKATITNPPALSGRNGSQTGITVNNDTTPPVLAMTVQPRLAPYTTGNWAYLGNALYTNTQAVSVNATYQDTISGMAPTSTIRLYDNGSPYSLQGFATTVSSSSLSALVLLNTSASSTAGILPGANAIQLVVQDNFGNATSTNFNVYYDQQFPKIVLTSPMDGIVSTGSAITVGGTATDDTCIASVIVNNLSLYPPVTCPTSWTFSTSVALSPDAVTYISVAVKDALGNTSFANASGGSSTSTNALRVSQATAPASGNPVAAANCTLP